MKENYVAAFLERSNYKNAKVVYQTSQDYKNLINEKTPDIIIYDSQNPSHMEGLIPDIEKNYQMRLKYSFLLIYSKN